MLAQGSRFGTSWYKMVNIAIVIPSKHHRYDVTERVSILMLALSSKQRLVDTFFEYHNLTEMTSFT